MEIRHLSNATPTAPPVHPPITIDGPKKDVPGNVAAIVVSAPVGDLLGSSLMNLLILAVLDLVN